MTAIKDLAASHTISYNGISFGPLVRYRLRGTPQYDQARRAVMYVSYVLSVTSWEYADTEGELSSDLLEKRQKLLENGGTLNIADIGFGDTATNGSHGEVVWGPHPISATFTPLGGGVCWQLTWECEFKVSECNGSAGVTNGAYKPFLMFNYQVAYSNSNRGFTTRHITGAVSFPQDGRTYEVKDWPLCYRDRIKIPVPGGYERMQNVWQENAAQNELAFTIIDKQLEHDPYPPGIDRAEVEFTVTSQQALANVNYGFSIAASVETLPGWPKHHAALVVFQIVYDKIAQLERGLYPAAIIPSTISIKHGIFGRRSSFSFTYNIAGAPANSIFQPGIIYQHDAKFGYEQWVSTKGPTGVSLRDLWSNRGQTDLMSYPEDIVNLCNAHRSVTIDYAVSRVELSPGYVPPLPSSYFTCGNVTEQNSWLAYEPVTQLFRTNNLRVSKRDAYLLELPKGGQSPQAALSSSSTSNGSPYVDPGDTVSRVGAPEQLFVFKGKGVRIKYPVSVPRLKAIEGVELDEVDFGQESVRGPSLYGGCAVWYGRWIQVYRPRKYLSGEVLAIPHPKVELASDIGRTISLIGSAVGGNRGGTAAR